MISPKLILFSLLFQSEICAQEILKIRVDPAISYGGIVSDYFEHIEYIPLETTKESLFGDIQKMDITDSSIIIQDDDTKAIYFFGLDGSFIKKIKIGNKLFTSFFIKNKNILQVTTFKGMDEPSFIGGNFKELFFSPKGELIHTDRKEFLSPKNNLIYLDDSTQVNIVTCYRFRNKDSLPKKYITLFDTSLNPIKSLINFTLNPEYTCAGMAGGQNINPNKGYFFVSTPFDHLLYKVNKDTAILTAQFTFPMSQTLSPSELKLQDKKMIDSVLQQIFRKSDLITTVGSIYQSNNLLYFHINRVAFSAYRRFSSEFLQYNYLYNFSNNKVVSLERLTPDKSNWFLPIIGYQTTIRGLYPKDNYFYNSVSSLQMFQEYEATKAKNPKYPPGLQNYFKTQNRKSNPVIVKMKLK